MFQIPMWNCKINKINLFIGYKLGRFKDKVYKARTHKLVNVECF